MACHVIYNGTMETKEPPRQPTAEDKKKWLDSKDLNQVWFRLDDPKLYPQNNITTTDLIAIRRSIKLSTGKKHAVFKKQDWDTVEKNIHELTPLDIETLLNIYYAVRQLEGEMNAKKNTNYLTKFVNYFNKEIAYN